MRKNIFGRQLKRDTNERKALFKSLVSALILNGSIKTTEAKAKSIKGEVDKLITAAKKGEIARRILQSHLMNDAVDKLISDAPLKYAKRQGGYSRIIKIGRRLSDNAEMVMMELVEGDQIENDLPAGKAGKLKMKNEKKEIKETQKLEAKPSGKVAKSKK